MSWFGWSGEESLQDSKSRAAHSSRISRSHHQTSSSKLLQTQVQQQQQQQQSPLDFSQMTDGDIKEKLNEMLAAPKSNTQVSSKSLQQLEASNMHFQAGNYTDALISVDNYLHNNSSNKSAIKLKAKIHDKLGEVDQAIRYYEESFRKGCRSSDITDRISVLMNIMKEQNSVNYDQKVNFWKGDIENYGELLSILNLKDSQNTPNNSTQNNLLDSFLDETQASEKLKLIQQILDYMPKVAKSGNFVQYAECLFETMLLISLGNADQIALSIEIFYCIENIVNIVGIQNVTEMPKILAIHIIISAVTFDLLDQKNSDRNFSSSSSKFLHSPVIKHAFQLSRAIFKDSYTKSEELIQIFQSAYYSGIENKLSTSSNIFDLAAEFDKFDKFNNQLKFDVRNCNLRKIMSNLSLHTPLTVPFNNINLNFNRLWILHLMAKVNSKATFTTLIKDTRWTKSIPLLPNSFKDLNVTFYDLILFLNSIKNSQMHDISITNEMLWVDICDSMEGSSASTASKTKIVSMISNIRTFQFNKLIDVIHKVNLDRFENDLIKEFKEIITIWGNSLDITHLKEMLLSKKCQLNFVELNKFIDELSDENADKSATQAPSCPIQPADSDPISLRLIDTLNNMIHSSTISNQQNIYRPQPSSHQYYEQPIPDRANQKIQDKEIPLHKAPIQPIKHPKCLYSTNCEMTLDRNKRKYAGKLKIAWHSRDKLSFEFIESATNLTKLLYFVNFIGSMPENPIKLKIMSNIEISWASVDFTNDTNGSIQKSMIKFDNNDELVKFVEHFARHQHVEVSEVIEDSDMKLSLERNEVVTDQDVMKSLEPACEEKSSDHNSKTSDADNSQADEVSQNISQASVGTNQQNTVSESSEDGQLKSNEPATIDIFSPDSLNVNEKSHGTLPLNNEPAAQPSFNFSFSPKPTNLLFAKPNDKIGSNLFSTTATPSPSSNVTETKQNTPTFANLFGSKTGEASSKDIKNIFQQPPGGASTFSSNSANKNETKSNEETKTTFQFNRFANSKSDNDGEPNQDPSGGKKDGIKQIDTETLPEIEREKLEETIGDVIFHSKAKLFRFNPDHVEWKQKGTGVFKVVVPHDKKGQGIVQFLLRREPMMMLSINCFITKDTSLDDLGKSALMTQFVASDYSTGECVDSLFSVKLPTKEIVQTFRETVRNVTNNPN